MVRETDIEELLRQIPRCHDIVTTGQKATDTLLRRSGAQAPPIGSCTTIRLAGREVRLWRMPSSSRAYPKPVEWKAEYYRELFCACGLLQK